MIRLLLFAMSCSVRPPRLMGEIAALICAGTLTMGDTPSAAAPESESNGVAFVVKSWRTIDGLPQNSVTAMAETPDGYLWLGTQGGLARFDGVRFVTYGLAEGLKGLSIRSLLEDGQGGLWIGTLGGGLSHWQNGVISTLTTADGLAHNDVFALAPAEKGALWVGTRRGLQHLGPNGFKQVGEADGVRGAVLALAPSPTEGLWLSVWTIGLFHYQDGRCEFVQPAPKARQLFPWSCLVDAEGALWIGMGNGVVMRRQEGKWTEFNRTNGLPFSYIGCLAQGPAGEIWAGSQEAGPYVFHGGRFHAVPGTDASVRSIKAGRDGVVWVGTRAGGLSRLARARVTSYPVGDGHRGQVNGLVEDPPGQFWVTTYDNGGLFQGSLDRLAPVPGLKELSDAPFLLAGIRMRDGTVYFAGPKRLLRKEAGTEKMSGTVIEGDPHALCEGVDGSLWLGTSDGELLRLVDGVPRAVTNGTFPAAVTGLVRGPGAALWLATQGAGLFRWEAGLVQRWTTAEGLPTDNLRALHLDGDGTLWIGTVGGGLAWMEEGRLHSVNSRQGLGDDTAISQILDDGQGNLWLGCNRGIFRTPKRELRAAAAGQADAVHPLPLDESDGLLSAECTGGYSPAGLRGQSGALYFSTVRGVVAVDPAQFGPSTNQPAVLIEQVKLDGKAITTRGGTLSLPAGSRELEIQFTAFNYAKPEQIRFRYRLAGREEQWIETGRERTVRYPQLEPGDYAFQLSAANQDGRWQETGARLAFTVLPFYWQTLWFRVFGGLLLTTAGGGVVFWRNREKRRLELAEVGHLRRESAERERADENVRLVVEGSPTGVVLMNGTGRMVLVNTRTEKLFGYTRGELIGHEVEMLLPKRFRGAHPGHPAGFFVAPQAGSMEGGQELFARRKDGTEFPVEIGLNAIQSEEGPLVLAAIVDITDRKQSEQELAQLRNDLTHLARVNVLGELAGSLAHELSQPLGAILRNAEAAEIMLENSPLDLEELRAIVTDIRRDDQRAGQVIDRLRSLLKRRSLDLQPIDLQSVIAEVLSLIQADAAARRVKIAYAPAPGLPMVPGDRIHLQQVLLNLIVNAMDAMDGSRPDNPCIQVSTRQTDPATVEVRVFDNGPGIAGESLKRLFEPFFTTKAKGMGMGLAVSKTIIEAHHGRLWAENGPEGGACFCFTLRAAELGGAP